MDVKTDKKKVIDRAFVIQNFITINFIEGRLKQFFLWNFLFYNLMKKTRLLVSQVRAKPWMFWHTLSWYSFRIDFLHIHFGTL